MLGLQDNLSRGCVLPTLGADTTFALQFSLVSARYQSNVCAVFLPISSDINLAGYETETRLRVRHLRVSSGVHMGVLLPIFPA